MIHFSLIKSVDADITELPNNPTFHESLIFGRPIPLFLFSLSCIPIPKLRGVEIGFVNK